MKKLAIALLVFIAILGIVLLLKINGVIMPSSKENKTANVSTSSTYSQEDIINLILKGKENLNNMQNVYYEEHTSSSFYKIYYKGNTRKKDFFMKSVNDSSVTSETIISTSIRNLDEKKSYHFVHQNKSLDVNKIDSTTIR